MIKPAGGIEALDRRLAELEESINSYPTRNRCIHCGSNDLEPTATESAADGARVVKYRCKACGRETSIEQLQP